MKEVTNANCVVSRNWIRELIKRFDGEKFHFVPSILI